MRDTIVDLYRHQEWADAELWRASELHPTALSDRELWERQHHIHLVQRAFLRIVQGGGMQGAPLKKLETYGHPDELKADARHYYADVWRFMNDLESGALDRSIAIPWFKGLTLPMQQALMQATLHSHYHRGQQATRLRQLGATPPNLDYIYWIWKGRPAAQWP
jgi:uncharacterized damage-inducible protein DinB